MSGKAAKIMLTEKQESILRRIHRSTTASQRLVQRVGIILLAFAGSLNVDIAQDRRIGAKASRRLAATLAAVVRRAGGYRMSRNAGRTSPCDRRRSQRRPS